MWEGTDPNLDTNSSSPEAQPDILELSPTPGGAGNSPAQSFENKDDQTKSALVTPKKQNVPSYADIQASKEPSICSVQASNAPSVCSVTSEKRHNQNDAQKNVQELNIPCNESAAENSRREFDQRIDATVGTRDTDTGAGSIHGETCSAVEQNVVQLKHMDLPNDSLGNVVVSEARSPNHFYIQLVASDLKTLMEQIQ